MRPVRRLPPEWNDVLLITDARRLVYQSQQLIETSQECIQHSRRMIAEAEKLIEELAPRRKGASSDNGPTQRN